MDKILESCGDVVKGWYCSVDRLRVGGVLQTLQQPGSVVNFFKRLYPKEEQPLKHFPDLTGKMKNEIQKLVDKGTPYLDLEFDRVSDSSTQEWLDAQYAKGPRAGSLVGIVRAREGVNSFSCRPRVHKKAKGNPRTGRRPVELA